MSIKFNQGIKEAIEERSGLLIEELRSGNRKIFISFKCTLKIQLPNHYFSLANSPRVIQTQTLYLWCSQYRRLS